MRRRALLLAIFSLCSVACNRDHSTSGLNTSRSAQQIKPDDSEHKTCLAHQTIRDGCGEYRVLSYDADWENDFGNVGAFVLEREGLTIHAHCGSENCWKWSEAVGKSVEADRSITDLVTNYEPSCEDPSYLKNALEYRKGLTGKTPTVADVCHQTLVVDKIEAR
jgi:hypothetical protein